MEIHEKLYVGDVVEMRKPHPCGGTLWEVVRVGADIGLICQGCGRHRVAAAATFCSPGQALCAQRGAGATDQPGANTP